MGYELVLRTGPGRGRRIPLPAAGEVSIGREASNDLAFPVMRLSRRHATVRTGERGVEVVDLGSANGTTVNGERVAGTAALAPGDVLAMGGVEFELVEVRPPVAAGDSTSEIVTVRCVGCGLALWENDLRQGKAWPTEEGLVCDGCAGVEGAKPTKKVHIGRYTLGPRIGSGGMGTVYRGVDPASGRPVALKVLDADLAQEPEYRKRFAREAAVGFLLAHPNIVALYEVGEVRGVPFLAMEYFPGESLAEKLGKNRRIPLSRVRGWVLQAAAALSYAHSQGVVHRDVKPGNLLVDEQEILKILDFGLGRFLAEDRTRLTISGEVIGTLAYASPEQIDDPRRVDHRADIYGLGATLYHLVTGESPFYHESHVSLMEKILNEDPPPMDVLRPNIPRRLMEVVLRSMRKDPAERYPTAEEFARELEKLLA